MIALDIITIACALVSALVFGLSARHKLASSWTAVVWPLIVVMDTVAGWLR